MRTLYPTDKLRQEMSQVSERVLYPTAKLIASVTTPDGQVISDNDPAHDDQ